MIECIGGPFDGEWVDYEAPYITFAQGPLRPITLSTKIIIEPNYRKVRYKLVSVYRDNYFIRCRYIYDN